MKVRLIVTACGTLAVLSMPGCIIEEIRDELVAVNTNMNEIEAQLAEAQTDLENLRSLPSIDDKLATVDTQLTEANDGLVAVDDRLTSMEDSLVALDKHLASLRETISNIDSTIPFLSLSGDEPGEAEADSAAEADGDAPASPENPSE